MGGAAGAGIYTGNGYNAHLPPDLNLAAVFQGFQRLPVREGNPDGQVGEDCPVGFPFNFSQFFPGNTAVKV